MPDEPRRAWVPAAAALAIALGVGIGISMRLEDPLSSPVIPAEDPYTHMALVREHLRDGYMDPLYEGGGMYPPGMHALLAAIWVYTGAELYDIVRLGPVAFGALGILGVGLLAARFHAPRLDALVAAGAASIAFAVAPEIIFRTTMMSPTALDLAFLPFYLYALLALVQGRLWWAAIIIPMSAYLVFSHPWVFGILGIAGAAFALLYLLMPWPESVAPPLSTRGLAIAVAVLGSSLAFALRGCAICGDGFGFVAGESEAAEYVHRWSDLLLLSLALSAALAFLSWKVPVLRGLHWRPSVRSIWWAMMVVLSLVMGLVLWSITGPAYDQGMPPFVNLDRMFGKPILVLAAAGWMLLPFVRSPAAYVGGAVAAATFPFVIYNPLDSEFWSHRTAAYLGIGLVWLVGVAVGAAARGAAAASAWSRKDMPESALRGRLPRPLAVAVPGLIVALLLTGGVYAATPDQYEGGWYRLFEGCDFEALEAVADKANADEEMLVITGDWQSKLVVAALIEDGGRVWFISSFFGTSSNARFERDGLLSGMESADRPVVVIEDDYAAAGSNTTFLRSDPWLPVETPACEGGKEPTVKVYEARWGVDNQ
jgi:hypothetical protein